MRVVRVIGVARRYGVAVEAYSPDEHRGLQWTPNDAFADWLRPRLIGADLVHAHMFGAWWAAAIALEGTPTPLVASEHNVMTWPDGDHSAAAKTAAPRLDAFFAHGPAARAWAATLRLDPHSVHEGRSAVEGLDASPLPGLGDSPDDVHRQVSRRQGSRRTRRGVAAARQ